MSDEDSITQTANAARVLFFDREGKPRGIDHYLASLTLHTLIRPAKWFEQTDLAKPDILVFKWRGDMMIYDPSLAEIFFSECSDPYCNRLLCNAAAVILEATGGIADKRLRDYACRRLSGDMPPPSIKPARGRDADDNRWRDVCIVGYLIPPLLRAEFSPTRNEATESESACSIVSQALQEIGIQLGGKRIGEIWYKFAKHCNYSGISRSG